MVYQAARINQSMKLYKTVAALFGVIKKLNLRLVLGTARKKILKEQETHIKFIREQLNFYDDL